MNLFTDMPAHSRVWIFQADRELTHDQVLYISDKVKIFLDEWAAHKVKLMAGFEILYNRFLIVAVDEKVAAASGCSIDKLFHVIRDLEVEFKINFFDRTQIAYLSDNNVVGSIPLLQIEDALKNKIVKDNTIIFDNLVDNIADLNSRWKMPLKQSWIKDRIR